MTEVANSNGRKSPIKGILKKEGEESSRKHMPLKLAVDDEAEKAKEVKRKNKPKIVEGPKGLRRRDEQGNIIDEGEEKERRRQLQPRKRDAVARNALDGGDSFTAVASAANDNSNMISHDNHTAAVDTSTTVSASSSSSSSTTTTAAATTSEDPSKKSSKKKGFGGIFHRKKK